MEEIDNFSIWQPIIKNCETVKKNRNGKYNYYIILTQFYFYDSAEFKYTCMSTSLHLFWCDITNLIFTSCNNFSSNNENVIINRLNCYIGKLTIFLCYLIWCSLNLKWYYAQFQLKKKFEGEGCNCYIMQMIDINNDEWQINENVIC